MKQLVLTLATGKYSELGELTYPSMKDYAAKTKSDFHVVTDSMYPDTPMFEKLRVQEYLGSYDRVLYLDVDIIIRKDCPNLFDMVPAMSFAAYNEGADVDDDGLRNRRRLMVEMSQLCGVPFHDPEHDRYFNAGVMVLGKSHACLFDEPAAMDASTMGDQSYINIMLDRVMPDLYHLPKCFNQMPFNRSKDFMESSYVIHMAGGEPFEDKLSYVRDAVLYWK